MIYLYFDEHWVKILAFKKSFLNQAEISFFSKKYETNFLDGINILNSDLLASAIKEGLNLAQPNKINEKNIYIVLPQNFFVFFRSVIPTDLAQTAIDFFIKDKAKSLMIDIENLVFNYYIKDDGLQKLVLFYGIKKESLENLNQLANLLDLRIEGVIPETLAYFKLFEKTIRKEKKEIIFFASYEKDNLRGYVYDSLGLLKEESWQTTIEEKNQLQEKLKEKFNQLNKEGIKINRLVLSGIASDDIRQDTFTKEVGVWTNPLKRIISNFYKDYLDKLILKQENNFSILTFDVCFGAFIFVQEEKFFLSVNKKTIKTTLSKEGREISLPVVKKEILIFIVSFIASFIFFILISKQELNFNKIFTKKEKITPTMIISSTTTPTPTPAFKKEDLKIKILNGSGIKGKAADLKNILKEMGYGEIITGNADNFDYKKTEINVKKDKIQARDMIKTDLKNYISSFKEGEITDKTESADVIIIIGADFR